MADIVDKATRSRMMSGIRGKDTKPELLIRKGLFSRGLRYRLHVKSIPGKPDIVFPRYRAIIMVHGCFWHGHNCNLFKWPSSNNDFWKRKIARNREVDASARDNFIKFGWRVLTVWECALKGTRRLPEGQVVEKAAIWLEKGEPSRDISGKEKH